MKKTVIGEDTYKEYRKIIKMAMIELKAMYETPIEEVHEVDYFFFKSCWYDLKHMIDAFHKIGG